MGGLSCSDGNAKIKEVEMSLHHIGSIYLSTFADKAQITWNTILQRGLELFMNWRDMKYAFCLLVTRLPGGAGWQTLSVFVNVQSVQDKRFIVRQMYSQQGVLASRLSQSSYDITMETVHYRPL